MFQVSLSYGTKYKTVNWDLPFYPYLVVSGIPNLSVCTQICRSMISPPLVCRAAAYYETNQTCHTMDVLWTNQYQKDEKHGTVIIAYSLCRQPACRTADALNEVWIKYLTVNWFFTLFSVLGLMIKIIYHISVTNLSYNFFFDLIVWNLFYTMICVLNQWWLTQNQWQK